MQLMAKIDELADAVGNKLIFATACSGSDLIVPALKLLLSVWQKQFRTQLEANVLFAAEDKVWKQEFIQKVHQTKVIFENVMDLEGDRAMDAVSKSMVRVARAHMLMAGFECDSISGLNIDSAANKGCVGREEGRSGQTAAGIIKYTNR